MCQLAEGTGGLAEGLASTRWELQVQVTQKMFNVYSVFLATSTGQETPSICIQQNGVLNKVFKALYAGIYE